MTHAMVPPWCGGKNNLVMEVNFLEIPIISKEFRLNDLDFDGRMYVFIGLTLWEMRMPDRALPLPDCASFDLTGADRSWP
jgi:hypothetical protein